MLEVGKLVKVVGLTEGPSGEPEELIKKGTICRIVSAEIERNSFEIEALFGPDRGGWYYGEESLEEGELVWHPIL